LVVIAREARADAAPEKDHERGAHHEDELEVGKGAHLVAQHAEEILERISAPGARLESIRTLLTVAHEVRDQLGKDGAEQLGCLPGWIWLTRHLRDGV
jgi:hypothetical protein